MKVKIQKEPSGELIYLQELGDDAQMNKVVGFFMSQAAGTELTSTVSNNGHDLTFRNKDVDVVALIRTVNGIVTRTGARNKGSA